MQRKTIAGQQYGGSVGEFKCNIDAILFQEERCYIWNWYVYPEL